MTVAGHRYSQFINSKLLQPLDTGKISNWKNLNTAYQDAPWARIDGNLWGLPILAGYEGLARNVDYVKDAPSWEIMFDPEYKGQTSYIVSDFMTIAMQYLGHDGDFVTYADKPDIAQKATNEARDLLIKHKDMVRKYYDAGSESAADVHQRGYLSCAFVVRSGCQAHHWTATRFNCRFRRKARSASAIR